MALGTRTPRELPMRRIDSFIGEIITRYNILAIRSEVVSVGSPLVPERLWKALGVRTERGEGGNRTYGIPRHLGGSLIG